MLRIIESSDTKALGRLAQKRATGRAEAEAVAREILEEVRRRGDRALIQWSERLDRVDLRKVGFSVTRDEIRAAYSDLPRGFIAALRAAARNIRATAHRQLPRSWQMRNGSGVRVGQLIRPLERVACYIPGGRFPLPSTVLMCVIPAQVAGVREILITSPRPSSATLVAADVLGVREVFRLGGAQAIAAFAFGTESVPRADKIVGPGNRYVAAAKRLLAGECGIDFVAGPTELVVVGARGRPQWIAADLVAQAEHDVDAVAMFITPSRRLARGVQASIAQMLRQFHLPVAANALKRQGAIILTRSLKEAVELSNALAPEHLTLLGGAAERLEQIQSAGSIFLGGYSAVAAGDYASGTNHVLPTGGMARWRGGLSPADFVKTISVQQLSRRGLSRLRGAIVTLANAEGLKAHAHSVETRFMPHGPTPQGR